MTLGWSRMSWGGGLQISALVGDTRKKYVGTHGVSLFVAAAHLLSPARSLRAACSFGASQKTCRRKACPGRCSTQPLYLENLSKKEAGPPDMSVVTPKGDVVSCSNHWKKLYTSHVDPGVLVFSLSLLVTPTHTFVTSDTDTHIYVFPLTPTLSVVDDR